MAEYIEREAAIAVCSNQYTECLRKNDWCGDTVAWNICYGIKAIPAADVAPVVRCKDCTHWQLVDERIEHMECDIFCGCYGRGYPTSADNFCSYGERKVT